MKIAAFPKYEPKGPSARLRFYQFEREFEEAGEEVTFYPLFENVYIESLVNGKRLGPLYILKRYIRQAWIVLTLSKVDLVWIERELFPWIPAWIEQLLLRRQQSVVLDYDDAIFNLYIHHRFWIVRKLLQSKIPKLMSWVNGVVSGSRYLHDYATENGARERILIPTCVRLKDYPNPPQSKSLKDNHLLPVVGWIGTPSSAKNLTPLLPVLNRVAIAHAFRFVAVGASTLKWEDECFEFEYIPWSEKQEVALLQGFDIGIMPLQDTPFNRGKCGFKLIQYMACGLPVIASPVGENRWIVENGEQGLHAEDEVGWEKALIKCLSDVSILESMGREGRLRVEKKYSVESQFPILLKFLRTAAGTVEAPLSS